MATDFAVAVYYPTGSLEWEREATLYDEHVYYPTGSLESAFNSKNAIPEVYYSMDRF